MPINHDDTSVTSPSESPKKTSKKVAKWITLAIFATLLVATPFVVQFSANKYTNTKLLDFFSSLGGECTVGYSSATYNIWKRDLIIKNIDVVCGGKEALKIEEAVLKAIVLGTPIPSNMVAHLSGGTFFPQTNIFGKLAEIAKKLEYSSVPFYGQIAYTHGTASKDFKITTFQLTAEGIGEVNAELKVAVVKAITVQGFINSVWENKPTEFWVSFRNNELASRIVAYYAKATNADPKSAKAAILRGLEGRISRKFKADFATRERLVQLYRFFQNQSELVIKLDAKQDTSLKDVYKSLDYNGWRAFTDSLAKFKPEIFTN